MKLILASGSPRRKEILTKFGYTFSTLKSSFEEKGDGGDPKAITLSFAKGKALDVFFSLPEEDRKNSLVLGADTVVYFGGKILGKPKDGGDAVDTLKMLSGNEHKVYTGYAVISEKLKCFGCAVSDVVFNTLSDAVIMEYVATGKPLDKAGSYGLQDGYGIVDSVRGSVYNVIGLPIEELSPVLSSVLK